MWSETEKNSNCSTTWSVAAPTMKLPTPAPETPEQVPDWGQGRTASLPKSTCLLHAYCIDLLAPYLHVITWNILPRAIPRCNLSTLISEDPNLLSWEPNSAYIQPTGVSTKAIGTYSLSSVVFHTPKAAAVPWTITLKVGSISSLSWKSLLCSCCFPDAPEMPH